MKEEKQQAKAEKQRVKEEKEQPKNEEQIINNEKEEPKNEEQIINNEKEEPVGRNLVNDFVDEVVQEEGPVKRKRGRPKKVVMEMVVTSVEPLEEKQQQQQEGLKDDVNSDELVSEDEV